jgi:hypothetical protein
VILVSPLKDGLRTALFPYVTCGIVAPAFRDDSPVDPAGGISDQYVRLLSVAPRDMSPFPWGSLWKPPVYHGIFLHKTHGI